MTVKLHTRRILRKLGAKNRTEAVVKARDAGLLLAEPG
ncbi:MAG: LuxR C-terminal-related transcriptional regulator [Alphaproteobacteria bacterium]